MNKLFRLIYVNLLDLFDINKIIIARETGGKSNLEKRTILVALLHVLVAYFLYIVFSKLTLSNYLYLLAIGYLVSTFYCFVSDFSVVESTIFKGDDIEFLLSYPVSKNQILFSKLFVVYLKNMLMVALLMGTFMFCYYLKVGDVADTLIIMYILIGLTVPLIPMVLSTIIAYVNDYFKTKMHNNWIYKFIKFIIICMLLIVCILVFKNVDSQNIMEDILLVLFNVYPLVYVLIDMLQKESMLLFIVMLAVPILCCYLYAFIISNNYLKICSLLKGVKTVNHFTYRRSVNLGRLGGLFRKEFLCLFKNKPYLVVSFALPLSLTIILIVMCNSFDISSIKKGEAATLYFNLFAPLILSICASIGCSTISAMSLEKGNIQMLRSMPLSMAKILFSKCLLNILIGLVFVIVNGSLAWCYFDLNKWSIFFCYLIPFISLVFVTVTGILLDYRFIEKDENEDGAIINQRLITMVPMFVSLIIGISPIFIPIYKKFVLFLGAYAIILVIGIIVELLYLLINKNKLLRNLS